MKLLIGGKSRNIYMRKDGSAYYKSGGQQVDVTYMFKKNGGGLKKQYIKGGAKVELLEDPSEVGDKSKVKENRLVVYDEQQAAEGKAAVERKAAAEKKAAAERIEEEAGRGKIKVDQNVLEVLNKPKPLPSLTEDKTQENRLVPFKEFKESEKQLVPLKKTGREAIEQIKEQTLTPTPTAEAKGKTLQTVIAQPSPPPPSNAKTGSRTELEVLTDITALDKFPSNENLALFYEAYFDLTQLVISVTNKLYKKINNAIVIKAQDKETAERQVTKINAIINFFIESELKENLTDHKGIFSDDYRFNSNFSNYKIYLMLFKAKDKDDKFFIKRNTGTLTLGTIIKLFGNIGIIPYISVWNNDEHIKLRTNLCNNINIFLKMHKNFTKISLQPS